MGLRDWKFFIPDDSFAEEDHDDAIADVKPVHGRRVAEIRFCSTIRECHPTVVRHATVHELVHCHFHQMQEQVEQDLVGELSRQADELFSHSFRRNLENGVDSIATVIAEFMPLIDWEIDYSQMVL